MFYGNFKGEKKEQFQSALQAFKGMFTHVFANDNIITFNRNLTFSKDDAFMSAFRDNATTQQEKSLIWRLHTLCWAAQHCVQLDGDFVECGVYKGFSMSVVAQYIGFKTLDKHLYLYDTYEGIPPEYNSENRSNRVYEQEADLYGQVVSKFSPYPNIKVIQGTVPDTFQTAAPEQIAFWHIDMNSSKSELAALEVLYDRVVPGGIILFDDFGWFGYDKQAWAEIEFMQERNHKILELPTGQGMVLKFA